MTDKKTEKIIATISENKKNLNDMVLYIIVEGYEKAEEIDVKTEEQFAILKKQYVQNGKIAIDEEIKKREKQFKIAEKITLSNIRQKFKCQESENKFQHFENIHQEIRTKIQDDIMSENLYKKLLKLLILEGLYMLLEENIIMYCCKRDLRLVESVIPYTKECYKRNTNKNLVITIDENTFLPEDVIGGVTLTNYNRKIIIENTLDLRLERILEKYVLGYVNCQTVV